MFARDAVSRASSDGASSSVLLALLPPTIISVRPAEMAAIALVAAAATVASSAGRSLVHSGAHGALREDGDQTIERRCELPPPPAVPARAARRAARTARHTLRTCRRARRRRTRAPRPLSGARLPSAQVGAHDDGHARDARVEAPRRRRRQLRDARRHAPRRPPAAVRGARRRGARLEPADVHSRPGLAPRRRRGRRRLPRQRARADRRARGGGRRQLQGVRRPRRAAEPVLTLDRLCPLPRPPHHFPPAPPPAPRPRPRHRPRPTSASPSRLSLPTPARPPRSTARRCSRRAR